MAFWWTEIKRLRMLLEQAQSARESAELRAVAAESRLALRDVEVPDLWRLVSGLLEAHKQERSEMLARIVAYDPNLPNVAPKPESQAPKNPEAPVEVYSAEELAEQDIAENSDGGYLDKQTGALYETVEDIQEWRAALRKKGLPTTIHPTIVQESGLDVGLEAARNRRADGNQEVKP